MADILDFTNLTYDPSQYVDVKILDSIGNEMGISAIKIVADKRGTNYLHLEYNIEDENDHKMFFRNISFLSRCSHPLLSQLKGFSFFTKKSLNYIFTTISNYPENGFLMEFMEKVNKGIVRGFDDTAKSKFLFGAAFIGNFLHSRGIIHRCFSPPSFGVNDKFEPILLTMSSSKSGDQDVNKTLRPGNFCWTSPETDSDSEKINPNYRYAIDIFSFGTIAYYLIKGVPPFQDKSAFKVIQKKKRAIEFIPNDISEELAKLLEECWSGLEGRPHFYDIMIEFQNHNKLFPDTNFEEFDLYVEKLLSMKIESPVCKLVQQNKELSDAVNTINESILQTYKLKYNSDVLNALYAIKEQTDSYTPLLIKIERPGFNDLVTLQASSFMFVACLANEIKKLFGIPEVFQKIEINGNRLIDEPYLTMEQLDIKTGSILKVYNSFGSKSLGSDILNLDIQYVGKVSISYLNIETISMLKNDISFSTRIPIQSLKLQFSSKGKVNNLNDDGKTLESYGIMPNDLITVTTNHPNQEFTITLEFIDGKRQPCDTKVTQLTKISTMLTKVQINTTNCYATYNAEILCPYKAFVDYRIKGPTTIMIHTNAERGRK